MTHTKKRIRKDTSIFTATRWLMVTHCCLLGYQWVKSSM